MAEKIVYEFGKAPNRFQVVDTRDWKFGFTVSREAYGGKGFVDIASNLSKKDAKNMALSLSKLAEENKETTI